jgi:hypothetical protein
VTPKLSAPQQKQEFKDKALEGGWEERDKLKTGERGSVSKRGGFAPSLKSLPPLLQKERGIKGVRLANDLDRVAYHTTDVII